MIVSSARLVSDANRQIQTISVEEAKALYAKDKGKNNVLFVDIRDVRELDRQGKIPGAMHAPRGMLEFWIDPEGEYHRKEFSSGKKFVFFCAAGWRSALTTKTMQDMGLAPVCHIEGGFDAWKKAGGVVEKTPAEKSEDQDINARPHRAKHDITALGHSARLAEQIGFILEIDKLKQIWRQTPLLDNSRKENDAEHSWQLAMMAVVLSEYAPSGTDIMRALKMVLIHDIVEIDAGDTPAYSGITKTDQHAVEVVAADRLFGLLPDALAIEFRALWDEFEQMHTPDALFARAMDRLQPFLHNYFTDGEMWIKHKITADQVRTRMQIVAKGSDQLHALISDMIRDAIVKGFLLP